jgi:hypothetical protein
VKHRRFHHMKNKMEAAARLYAKINWKVFPVHTPTGNSVMPCSCRIVACPRIDKHPCHKITCKDRGKHLCHQSVCDRVGKHPRTKTGYTMHRLRHKSSGGGRYGRMQILVLPGNEVGFSYSMLTRETTSMGRWLSLTANTASCRRL